MSEGTFYHVVAVLKSPYITYYLDSPLDLK